MKFDRVVCINLDRRYDRWDEFSSQLNQLQPFGDVERVSAIDGQRVSHPAWWRSGKGAWGCFRSHLRVIEEAINSQLDSILIFEDDALLCDDFTLKANAFIESLPEDWQWAYLGGQHWKIEERPPIKINDRVSRGWNIQRTHAYAIRGRDAMQKIYKHLTRCDWHSEAEDPHHVDKQFGRFQVESKIPVYCPPVFIVGQRAGKSNIGDRQDENWWNNWSVTTGDSPMVAVLGPFRGGTSCTAGVLHSLGVSMGRHFEKAKPSNPKGFFEASQLAQICRRSYKEPWLKEQNTREQRISLLRMWGNARRRELDNAINGGKHPTLCMMGPELLEAWGNVKWISVERPVAEVTKSLKKRGWGWPKEAAEKVLPNMIDTRDRFLSTLANQETILRVPFRDLVANPIQQIDRMIEFLDIQPTQEQIEAAIEFVDPKLKTVV